jgi:hypothetical protein
MNKSDSPEVKNRTHTRFVDAISFLATFAHINYPVMARRKLSQTQIASIIILWIVLVVYILLYAEITAFTIITILMSGAFVLIPIYKSLKK